MIATRRGFECGRWVRMRDGAVGFLFKPQEGACGGKGWLVACENENPQLHFEEKEDLVLTSPPAWAYPFDEDER